MSMADDESERVLVVTGADDRTFCARSAMSLRRNPLTSRSHCRYVTLFNEGLELLHDFEVGGIRADRHGGDVGTATQQISLLLPVLR